MSALSRPTAPFIGAVEDEWQLYSDTAEDYTLGPPIGFGSSSIVYQATYHPKNSQGTPVPCALKVLDLDKLPQGSLRLLRRETQMMSLSKHPNVLRVRGSWLDVHRLHIALRLMNAGSAADVMHYAWPGGMEEEVVRCILRQALEGLNYLHINGFIHRDIKAANLLIDDDGTVLLGDLGVSAPLNDEDHTHTHTHNHVNEYSMAFRAVIFDSDVEPAPRLSKVGKRRSFVGTPCWMAPELISGIQYDSSADIWSFGITALELAQGRAPRSREPSRTLLSHIVEAAPPTLDRNGGVHKYSRAFKEIVERCLVKDPSLRPTAAQLLQTPFFKNAKKGSFLVGAILRDLPPLTQRIERRKQPTLLPHGTIDSWDFPTTLLVPSPTHSIFHRSHLTNRDDPNGIDEQDERVWVNEVQTGDATGTLGVGGDSSGSGLGSTDQIQRAAACGEGSPSPSTTDTPSPSKRSSNAGDAASTLNSESLSPKTSTGEAASASVAVSPSGLESPPPNHGLWRRFRRPTGHSKEAVQERNSFINSILRRGEGGREASP